MLKLTSPTFRSPASAHACSVVGSGYAFFGDWCLAFAHGVPNRRQEITCVSFSAIAVLRAQSGKRRVSSRSVESPASIRSIASQKGGLRTATLWLSTIVGNLGLMAKPTDLVQGTLDLLILKTISLEPKHGWAIAKRIQQVSQDALQIQQGSLYPALHRLEQQAWIKAEWRPTETGRMAKFYSLTRSGRKQLEKELANWVRLSNAINVVVQEA